MRAMLTKHVENMRALRKQVLIDGNLNEERVKRYAELAASAASLVDTLTDVEVIGGHIPTIINMYNRDTALKHYDTTQDSWWNESEEGRSFLNALRTIAAHYLHGNLCSPEDAFHVFQMVKHIYEDDEEYRKAAWFMLPVYGGLYIPLDYIGRLLVHMSGNKNLVLAMERHDPTLLLDWYPDDGATGVKETTAVLEAAAKLGYIGIDFRMPQEYKYEELYKTFGNSLHAKKDGNNWRGRIRCEPNYGDCHPDRLFQQLENGEKRLGDVPVMEFEGKTRRCFEKAGNRLIAACLDSVGFAKRLLFTAEENENSIHGGIYLTGDTEKFDSKSVADVFRNLIAHIRGIPPELEKENVFQMVKNATRETETISNAKSTFAYVTVRDSRGNEEELEGAD